MINKKRLHPIAVLLRFIRSLRELAVPLIVFLFVGGGGDGFFGSIYLVGMFVIIVGMLIYGILSWLRFSYRVENEELRIEFGVIVRKKRYIPLERIQSIDITSGVIQRLFGLVKLQVETAGGGDEAEAVLSAVTKEDAEELKIALSKRSLEEEAGSDEKYEQITLSPKDILIMATTSGGIGVVLSALFAFFTQLDDMIPYDYVYGFAKNIVGSSFILIAVGISMIILFAWVFSIASALIKFGNYKLVKKGENLFITRGLLEKREMTIPIKRVQAVRIQENMIRQLIGYASIYIEVAGGAMDKKEDLSTYLLPLIHKKDVRYILERFTPDFIVEEAVNPLPKRAKKRYILRLLIPALIVSVAVCFLLNPWGYLSLMILPISVLLGIQMYKEAGWVLLDHRLLLQYRFINRHTVYAKKNRIQAFHLVHSFFQKKNRLASIVISTQSKLAGKHFKVVDVAEEDANQLYQWYSYEKKQPL
ncbi:PH domain-containing protein [Bacillus pinisoli]|uniref:PH domain-containing protein n=1 Tax=Bacillus pinisoli TaxID=2901866 RepID=UPI001FF5BFF6|nr:PH domain-containing protein [Bacillus pinisoli]